MFRWIDAGNLGSAFSPEVLMNRVFLSIQWNISTSFPFWVRPVSSFGLFMHNDVYQQFSSLSHITPACSLTALLLAALPSPRGFGFICWR